MNTEEIEHEILTCANEDYSLLWELVASLRNIWPEASETELIDAVRNEVLEQLHKGWVRVFQTPSWTNQDEFKPLSMDESERLLAEGDAYTYSPGRDPKLPCYWIGTTDLGEQVWRKGKRGRSQDSSQGR